MRRVDEFHFAELELNELKLMAKRWGEKALVSAVCDNLAMIMMGNLSRGCEVEQPTSVNGA